MRANASTKPTSTHHHFGSLRFELPS